MTVTDFLSAFFPDENEPLFLFGYNPKELPEEFKNPADRIQTTRREIKTSRELQNRLRLINKNRGLYFTVNSGGTVKVDINRINAYFCEIDDLPLQEQHDIFDNASYPPSLRVETKKSVHAYWLPEENNISIDDWIFIQRGLIEHFNSDKAIKNQNRVMRLPFFNHVSYGENGYQFKPVQITHFNGFKFALAEMKEQYSPKEVEAVTHYEAPKYSTDSEGWESVFDVMRRKFEQLPGYHLEHGGRLASARGVCHNGDTNRTLVLNLQTGKVFCRNECSYTEIMRALGVDPPEKKQTRFSIPRVAPRSQTSPLYKWLKQAEVN